jgi:tetratricopeptide (TPR) repeat protein
MGLMAVALRKQNKLDDAQRLIDLILKIDPTDFLAWREQSLNDPQAAEPFRRLMRDNPQSYIELSLDYGNAGLFKEALEVLEQYDRLAHHTHIPPMIIYYTSYYQAHSKFMADYDMPSAGSMDYVFPHRLEDIAVLNEALSHNPKDAHALYYLGNILFAKGRIEEGIKMWEKSAEEHEFYSVLHRNLGLAYWKINKDLDKAATEYRQALANNDQDTTLYLELAAIYREQNSKEHEFDLWQKCDAAKAMRGGEAKSRLADLYLQFGKYDEALKFLTTNYFDNWELSGGTHQVYENILIKRGDQKYLAGDIVGAAADYAAATEYPKNLGVGEPPADRRGLAPVFYRLAVADEKLSKTEEAHKCWQEIIKERPAVLSFGKYTQVIAFLMLGKNDDAKAALDEMGKALPTDYQTKPKKDMVNNYLIAGLIAKARGDMAKAKEMFNVVLETTPNQPEAIFELSLMK